MGLVHRTHRSPSPVGRTIFLGAAVLGAAFFFGAPSCGDAAAPGLESEEAASSDGGGTRRAAAQGGESSLDLSFPAVDRTADERSVADEPSESARRRPVRAGTDVAGGPEDLAVAPFDSKGEKPIPERVGGADALRSRIESIVATSVAAGGKASKGKVTGSNTAVSIMAVDVATGSVLIRRMADLPLIPASNLKLMTSAAALAGLGPRGQFRTPFEAVGSVRDGVLHGDLVARAGGDPLYRVEGDGGIARWAKPLAGALQRAGIRKVTGALILDEGTWLKPGPGPEWPAASQHWKDYCALAGGFSVNAGSFRATVTPRADKGRVDVQLRPKHHGLRRRGTVKLGKRNAVNVGANKSGVTVKGTIPGSSAPLLSEFSAPDPVDLFGHAMVGALQEAGVTFDGGYVRARGYGARGQVVHTIETPIASVLAPILEDSHNAVADQLFLTLGAQTKGAGTRAAAAAAVRAALDQIGVPSDGLVQVDGSGLSKANRTTAMQLVALVAAVMQTGGETASVFLDALPVAGKTGSLSKRMRGTVAEGRVRAKTGWVSGASSLSGVATTTAGRTVVFSILVGYPRVGGLNPKVWKPMQDQICEAIVGWDSGGSK